MSKFSDQASGNARVPSASVPRNVRRTADLLRYSAAPIFAVMCVVVSISGDNLALCSTGSITSPISGMAFMYLLMSAIHLGPWLKNLSRMGG